MPTSSMAAAAKRGTALPGQVLGRVPPSTRKPRSVGSAPSFPPRPKEPDKQHQRGPGRPPAPSLEGLAPPPPEAADDPLDAESWGAADPRIKAQLERELRGIREQLALRQQISAAKRALTSDAPHSGVAGGETVRDGFLDATKSFSERELDALSVRSLESLAAPPEPVDKEEARLGKRVANFEALIVRKLVARTPRAGPGGPGALKLLTKAFSYYDQQNDGTVDLGGFTKVLHDKLNAVSQLPPPAAEKEVVAALFQKHAKGHPLGELDYASFARKLLHAQSVLVPAEEEIENRERAQWRYGAAVGQALDRRNLSTSRATVPIPGPREAWGDVSAAARAAEEAAAYRIEPRNDINPITGAAGLRGRVPGGPAGLAQLKAMEAAKHKALMAERRSEFVAGREDAERARQVLGDAVRDAAANWAKIEEQNRLRMGMTPGEVAAAERRRR